MRSMRGSAVNQFFDNLSAGDPVAIGIAVGFGLLLAFVAGVAVHDRKQRAKERTRSSSKGTPRRG